MNLKIGQVVALSIFSLAVTLSPAAAAESKPPRRRGLWATGQLAIFQTPTPPVRAHQSKRERVGSSLRGRRSGSADADRGVL